MKGSFFFFLFFKKPLGVSVAHLDHLNRSFNRIISIEKTCNIQSKFYVEGI